MNLFVEGHYLFVYQYLLVSDVAVGKPMISTNRGSPFIPDFHSHSSVLSSVTSSAHQALDKIVNCNQLALHF